MNIRGLNVKLLIVFDAVFAERNVTRAAQKLGMSQPAVSTSIDKLRKILNDQLFYRTPIGVRPTNRAIDLAKSTKVILSQIQTIFEPEEFNPQIAVHTFSLAMSDQSAGIILPKLFERIRIESPTISLRVQPKSNTHVAMELDGGEIDLAIGIIPATMSRFEQIELFTDQYVCVMRSEHRLARQNGLTAVDFLAADHLMVTHNGEASGAFDRILQKEGFERRIAVSINQYPLALELLATSDLILTALRRVVKNQMDANHLAIVDCPFATDPIPIKMLWHPINTGNPAHEWLRQKIISLCRDLLEQSLLD